MPIQIACPSCAKQLRVPEDLFGQVVCCPSCQTTFTATAPAEASPLPVAKPPEPSPQSSPPSEGAVGMQTQPFEPKPRRDEDDDHDSSRPSSGYLDISGAFRGRPHRGVLVMVLGIIGLAIAVFGMCPYLTLGEFIAFGLSLAAWILGRRDLAAIKQGEMDPKGQDMTQVGWICGIIGTSLSVVVGTCVCAIILFYVVVIIIAAASGK